MPGLRQIRHVEHQDPSRVLAGRVAVDVGVERIFDFDAGHVALGAVIAHHDVSRLTHIDACIRCANCNAFLEQQVFRLHRVNAVRSVLLVRAVGPFGAHAANDDVTAFVDLEAVPGRILYGDILDREIAGIDEQSFGALHLIFKREYRLIHALAAYRHARHVKRQATI